MLMPPRLPSSFTFWFLSLDLDKPFLIYFPPMQRFLLQSNCRWHPSEDLSSLLSLVETLIRSLYYTTIDVLPRFHKPRLLRSRHRSVNFVPFVPILLLYNTTCRLPAFQKQSSHVKTSFLLLFFPFFCGL